MTLSACRADLDAKLRRYRGVVPPIRASRVRRLIELAEKVGTVPDYSVIDVGGRGVVLWWFGPDAPYTRIGYIAIVIGGVSGWTRDLERADTGTHFAGRGGREGVVPLLKHVGTFMRGVDDGP